MTVMGGVVGMEAMPGMEAVPGLEQAMEDAKPQCGSGAPVGEYDLPLHVGGLCKLESRSTGVIIY